MIKGGLEFQNLSDPTTSDVWIIVVFLLGLYLYGKI